ncbi:MAG: AMP phosphorylase [Halobacteriota archaeon]
MKLRVKEIDIGTETPTALLNRRDAEELGANPLDRIIIRSNGDRLTGIVEVTDRLVESGVLGATERIGHLGGEVDVSLAPNPESVSCIRDKLDDKELTEDEIARIVRDIDRNMLNDIELGSYVTAIYCNGLSMNETIALSTEMASVGGSLEWNDDVVADKHSIGGVAGNRVTPVVVSIVAAAGVKIPKTSSRAITSAAGTADTVEVFCDVGLSIDEMKDVVETTNGCMVWGGSVDLSPVDDRIIRAEHPLSIDPPGQVIASVLSKKKSAGSNHLVLDIPYGEGAKVHDLTEARRIARDFKRVSDHLDIRTECTITRGDDPVGRGIGPALEARDVLRTLEGEGPEDLRLKSLSLSDVLLEICDVDASAERLLDGGEALSKFREIVDAQNGDPDVEVADLEAGEHVDEVRASRSGVVTHVDSDVVGAVARRAGAPHDAGAGVYLEVDRGDEVGRDEVLCRIHAEKHEKLEQAVEHAAATEPVRVGDRTESLVERV